MKLPHAIHALALCACLPASADGDDLAPPQPPLHRAGDYIRGARDSLAESCRMARAAVEAAARTQARRRCVASALSTRARIDPRQAADEAHADHVAALAAQPDVRPDLAQRVKRQRTEIEGDCVAESASVP